MAGRLWSTLSPKLIHESLLMTISLCFVHKRVVHLPQSDHLDVYVAYMRIYPAFPYIIASCKFNNTLYSHACTRLRVLIWTFSDIALGI